MTLLKQVLGRIKPNEREVLNKVNPIIERINHTIKKWNINAKCVLGGSIAKGTFLKGDHDCDLFVKFDLSMKDESLSDILENLLNSTFKNIERIHGSRDYFQFNHKSIKYEVVPVLNLKSIKQLVNVTDASPLHVAWVRKHNKGDQIRLAKAFCKGIGVYGAESYVKGFSGHVLDILVIHYKSFLNLLKASRKWEDKTIIDHSNTYKGNALKKLNASKIESPLIIIDPIQKDRNAAAALSEEKFNLFKEKAKEFLKHPQLKYFKKPKFNTKRIKSQAKKKGYKIIILKAKPLEGKEDVVGAKLLKISEHLNKHLKLNEFNTIQSGWNWDKKKHEATYYFITDNKLLPTKIIRMGPPTNAKTHAQKFKKAHINSYTENNRLYAKIKRQFRKPDQLIRFLIKQDYIKEKASSIGVIK